MSCHVSYHLRLQSGRVHVRQVTSACTVSGNHLFALSSATGSGLFLGAQVESIMISIISMLSSPNDESPANLDAAKQWREDRDGFKKRVGRCVRKSQEFS